MNYKALCILVLLFSMALKSKSSIASMIGDWLDGVIENATRGLVANIKQAMRESLDILFDQKITSMINQLEATAERVIDRAKDDINQIIDHFKIEIEDLVNKAAATAKDLVDHTLEEIKTKIIDQAFDKLNKMEEKLFQDLTMVLNKVDAILKDVSCYAQAIVYRVTDEIKKALPSFINPFEECRIQLDTLFPGEYMRMKFVSSFTPNQLYEYRKCHLINPLKEDSPIEAVKMAYRDLELLSADMRCLSVSVGAISNEKYYIKEMGNAVFILNTIGI